MSGFQANGESRLATTSSETLPEGFSVSLGNASYGHWKRAQMCR